MKRLGILLLLPAISMLSGCLVVAAAGAATAGVLYVKGDASKTFSHDVHRTHAAATAVLQDAGVAIHSSGVDATAGRIEGTLADGKKIDMRMRAVGEAVTEVSLRIGSIGDRERSEYILSRMQARLR